MGGYGGIQHCLIPAPKHVLVDRDEQGNIVTRLFAGQQDSDSMMSILGYTNKDEAALENVSIMDMEAVEEMAHS